ncbi:MAG: 30S ribosomal protein S21 [Rhodobacteraceae bacterium]|nr:30S ribosomal protein S21 [Paracoccaceae bacterium]
MPPLPAGPVRRGRAPKACVARGGPDFATLDPDGKAAGPYKRRRPLVQVIVRDNNVDQALKALKKKMQREGIFREMKLRKSYEKPSERRAREKSEAIRRARKLERKRIEREGF